MTREQAIEVVAAIFESSRSTREIVDFVDALVRLEVLRVEMPVTTYDAVFKAAGERLKGAVVTIQGTHGSYHDRLTRDGAFEVLDVLRESGFTIVRE